MESFVNKDFDPRKAKLKEARRQANKNEELVATAKNLIFLDPAIATELLIEPRMMKKFRMNMESISPKFEKKLEP